MIDLTTRSGKYRIVQAADGAVYVEDNGSLAVEYSFIPKARPMVVLLELCTELEELREYARSAVNVKTKEPAEPPLVDSASPERRE